MTEMKKANTYTGEKKNVTEDSRMHPLIGMHD